MTLSHKCTACHQSFQTHTERNNHFRAICQTSISLTDLEGHIHNIVREQEKFGCPLCSAKFKRTNHLITHWKQCIRQDKTESKAYTKVIINLCSPR